MHGQGEGAPDGPDLPGERQFPHHHGFLQDLPGEMPPEGAQAEGDGQIVESSGFPEAGGGEIHGGGPRGQGDSVHGQGSAHPVPAFPHGRIGESDEGEMGFLEGFGGILVVGADLDFHRFHVHALYGSA